MLANRRMLIIFSRAARAEDSPSSSLLVASSWSACGSVQLSRALGVILMLMFIISSLGVGILFPLIIGGALGPALVSLIF